MIVKDDCLFCKIVRKEVPALILYEDDDILIMLDAYPNTDGHTLVIPKKHYEDIYETPEDELKNIFNKGKDEALKLMKNLNKDSLTFLINYGNDQVIKHLHLHLLPNFQNLTHNIDKEEIYNIMNKD